MAFSEAGSPAFGSLEAVDILAPSPGGRMNATAQRKQTVRGFQLPEVLAPLIGLPNWVVWRWVVRKNKKGEDVKTKPLFQPANPRNFAKSTDPTTWSDYATARAVVEAGLADGVGFCLL